MYIHKMNIYVYIYIYTYIYAYACSPTISSDQYLTSIVSVEMPFVVESIAGDRIVKSPSNTYNLSHTYIRLPPLMTNICIQYSYTLYQYNIMYAYIYYIMHIYIYIYVY